MAGRGRPRLHPEVRDARKRARARARCRRWMARYPEIRMLEAVRKRARERGTPCTITRADIQIPEKCPILGIPLLRGTGRSSASDSSSSLDCIDPHLGYIPGNVWVISWRVNRIKSDATLQELEAIAAGVRSRLQTPSLIPDRLTIRRYQSGAGIFQQPLKGARTVKSIGQAVIAIDKFFNGLFKGDKHETISSRLADIKGDDGRKIPWHHPIARIEVNNRDLTRCTYPTSGAREPAHGSILILLVGSWLTHWE